MALSAMPLRHFSLRMLAFWSALFLQTIRAAPGVNVLQWNPHWQCFVFNQHDCKGQAESHVQQWLPALDIDFANLIEFDDKNFTLPFGWTALSTTCGRDLVSLVYNDRRWRPTSSNNSRAVGCMLAADQPGGPDRPFLIQHFERISSSSTFDVYITGANGSADVVNGTSNGSSLTSADSISGNSTNGTAFANGTGVANIPRHVIVIGAHFPHPSFIGGGLPDEQYAIVRTPLQSIINLTGTQDVILIADTNLYSDTSSASIASSLGMPGSDVVATSLERTCCWDAGYLPSLTFDRVIANFGVDMMTKVLIEEPVPLWAQQVVGSNRGAFHKPIQGVIVWEHLHEGPIPAPGSHHKALIISLAVVAAVGAIGLAMLLLHSLGLRRKRGSKEMGLCEESDGSDVRTSENSE